MWYKNSLTNSTHPVISRVWKIRRFQQWKNTWYVKYNFPPNTCFIIIYLHRNIARPTYHKCALPLPFYLFPLKSCYWYAGKTDTYNMFAYYITHIINYITIIGYLNILSSCLYTYIATGYCIILQHSMWYGIELINQTE